MNFTNRIGKLAPYYKKLYQNKDISNFESLPFVTHEEIAQDPEAFVLEENFDKISEIFTGSGYSKKEKRIFLTENDVINLQRNSRDLLIKLDILKPERETLVVSKLNEPRIAKFSAERILNSFSNRTTIVDMYNQKSVMEALENRPEVVFAPWIIISKLIDYYESQNINTKTLGIKRIFTGGLPLPKNIRKRLETSLEARVTDLYGCSEAGGFFSAERDGEEGYHVFPPGQLYLEIIDENENPSEKGEITITCFGKEGTQLIRYKTGDIGEILTKECLCDYGGLRFKVLGRKDDMMFMGQMNFFFTPIIDNAILSIEGIKSYLIEIDTNEKGYDIFRILVEGNANENDLLESLRYDEELYQQIKTGIINFEVKYIDKIKDSGLGYKTKRIIDKRIGNPASLNFL